MHAYEVGLKLGMAAVADSETTATATFKFLIVDVLIWHEDTSAITLLSWYAAFAAVVLIENSKCFTSAVRTEARKK